MCTARDHVSVAVVGSKLYVAGGRDSGGANYPGFFSLVQKKVDVYDFSTEKWSTMAKDFPRPRAGAGTVSFKGTVYVAGGESARPTAWSEVDVLQGDGFVAADNMPFPRHGFGMFSCNNVIWVAGGAGVRGGGSSQLSTDAFFDGDSPQPCTQGATSAPTKTPTPTNPNGKETPSASASGAGQDNTKDSASPGPASTSPNPSESASPPVLPGANTVSPIQSPSTNTTEMPAATSDLPEPLASASAAPSDTSEPGGSNVGGSSNESPAPTSEPFTCFPGHATVQLRDGSVKAMQDLEIGDVVMVEHPNKFSEVFFFSHQNADHVGEFVHIETSVPSISLQLSSRHLLYVNGQRKSASDVRVGDKLSVAHSDKVATVTKVSTMVGKGLYNPHTVHGDITVNGVATSTFTTAVHPRVAKLLVAPFRVAYQLFGRHPVVHAFNRGALLVLTRFVW